MKSQKKEIEMLLLMSNLFIGLESDCQDDNNYDSDDDNDNYNYYNNNSNDNNN